MFICDQARAATVEDVARQYGISSEVVREMVRRADVAE
jgi:hypothetical protein